MNELTILELQIIRTCVLNKISGLLVVNLLGKYHDDCKVILDKIDQLIKEVK